ncbi:MAG: ribosomal protein S18-alanine N-acetyltransferase [Anaerolineales bacterium]|nr:ribosomal protein S18-alanine N-acetyltransferase [Anaerolineales bacterium]
MLADKRSKLAEAAGEFLVRPMRPEDIPAVMDIDRASFPNPWPENTYWYELQKNPSSRLLVIQSREHSPAAGAGTGRVVGVAGYWLVIDEAHISTFAVHPQWRNRGVGKVLLAALLRRAAESGALIAMLEVRAGNVAAQSLYRGFGFRTVGRRKGYYKNNGEDAVLMTADRLYAAVEFPLQEDMA